MDEEKRAQLIQEIQAMTDEQKARFVEIIKEAGVLKK